MWKIRGKKFAIAVTKEKIYGNNKTKDGSHKFNIYPPPNYKYPPSQFNESDAIIVGRYYSPARDAHQSDHRPQFLPIDSWISSRSHGIE